jgi:hypothetical protein
MIFKKSTPAQNLVRAQANLDRVSEKLVAAEEAVITAKQAVQRCALSSDDDSLGAKETAERAAVTRMGTMRTAKETAEADVARLQAQIAAEGEQELRRETASAIEAIAGSAEEAAKSFDKGGKALLEFAQRASLIITDVTHLEKYIGDVIAETPAAITMTAQMLRAHAGQVLSGMAPAAMPTRNAPPVRSVEVRPATTQAFTMKQVTWTAPEGLRFARRYVVLDLPPDVAARAFALKACTPVPSTEWRSYTGSYVPFDRLGETINLDLDSEAAVVPIGVECDRAPLPLPIGVRKSPSPNPDFVETIGKPWTLKIAAGGT